MGGNRTVRDPGRVGVAPLPLWLCGVTGTVGALAVLVGVGQPDSPFTLHRTGAWFFAAGPSGGADGRFLGVMLVYAGLVVMVASWFELVRAVRRAPSIGLGRPVAVVVAWAVPVLCMPPLFSRDVYSYAAQGALVRRGSNPYVATPSRLGRGPFLDLVDPLWRHAPAPYGPAWERLSGWIVAVSAHHVTAAVVGFRLAALVGVALIAWGVPSLARSVGRSPTVALALAVANPAVLLVLLGGAHNDALMLGLLVAGCAVARRGHIVPGLVLCALAAEVKVPALIGAVCIGWWWGQGLPGWRPRAVRLAAAVGIAGGTMVVVGLVSGLGWRWLGGLANPGTVVSWVDPATAVGLTLAHGAAALGAVGHSAAFVHAARLVSLGLAAGVSVILIVRSERLGPLQALGWSLLVFVVLGPIIWPWYETWGFVFLAVVAEGLTLRLLLGLSALACFADVPGAAVLGGAAPAVEVVAWTVLAGVVVAYALFRLVPSRTRAAVPTPPGAPDPVAPPAPATRSG